jgi:hypothetical protein
MKPRSIVGVAIVCCIWFPIIALLFWFVQILHKQEYFLIAGEIAALYYSFVIAVFLFQKLL